MYILDSEALPFALLHYPLAIPLLPRFQNTEVPHRVAQYGWFLYVFCCSHVDMSRAGSCLSLE